MLEADHSLTAMAMEGNKGDETLLVKFYFKARENPAKSAEAGRPIFEDVEYISIHAPGSRNGVARPVREKDKARFPEHYRLFQARLNQEAAEGTPLEEWPAIPRSKVEELRFFKIRTVEQLAATPDSAAQNFMGFNTLKTKAQAYIDAAKDGATADALKEANEKIEALMARLEELEKPKPKRKRRTKAEMEAAKSDGETTTSE